MGEKKALLTSEKSENTLYSRKNVKVKRKYKSRKDLVSSVSYIYSFNKTFFDCYFRYSLVFKIKQGGRQIPVIMELTF